MQVDTLILGAGAAGMMCAAHAGGRVLVVDHAKAAGEKIRISGGGRCNFTNLNTGPEHFLGQNRHFHKSALSRYSPYDFLDMVNAHGIAWHEKTYGQLFCDDSAKQIVAMLLARMDAAGAQLWLRTAISSVQATPTGYTATLLRDDKQVQVTARNLVVALGGKSIPKMGATGLAYDIATQFGLPLTETRAGLVPLTFADGRFAPLAGVATPTRVTNHSASFDEPVLFTHRGLSGPAILQISSYWREGESITLNTQPDGTLFQTLRDQRQITGRRDLTTELSQHLPARLVAFLAPELGLKGRLADQSDKKLAALCDALSAWQLTPQGSEGYRTAEVTLGGVNTDALNSSTMAAKSLSSLYFIGECVDVTGWLGGYNFQWAWASAMAAARDLATS